MEKPSESTKVRPSQRHAPEERAAPPEMPSDRPPPASFADPARIGRYRVIRRLGQGTFGRVYLAHDDDLDRAVAIKVPNPERVARPGDIEAYLAEARTLAKLDHARIVPVHDVGRTGDGLCYVVSKYIEGSDLAERLRHGRPSFRESAELVATIAEALHHAHMRGLVHRDLKPANILIDAAGRPWVADFGLALRDEDYGRGAAMAGTPAYMSPEQARGEGHRVDGRSDIFSLGAVFYELLTGRRPFRGDSNGDLLQQVLRAEEKPPRLLDDTIPRELERICQKMLAKRASERYSTARDLADDLRHYLRAEETAPSPAPGPAPMVGPPPGSTEEATPIPSTPAPSDSSGLGVKVVPKGLRSFDRDDAGFFLELLPGARDRDGLPESLRYWKTRIESIDTDVAFRVGLIYGSSGCGKTSLVKAGLLPRLGEGVRAVYVEVTAQETEARLLRCLRKESPELDAGMTLVDALAALRRGLVLPLGEKVLLVLDQFEQWLFAHRGEEESDLVAALRQCDGEHVQAIVLVRDDFWMAATRFMRDLEIDLLPNRNIAVVDLFGPRHARKVLSAFGRAYGALPERSADLSKDQESFLDQAIAGLAQDGKIVPVRLALFAEMVKAKDWSPSTLDEVGGTEGVGVAFLEESLAAPQANPKHRLHQKAARAVLKALLPRTGADIRGRMRPEAELREASGYADRPRDFDELIHILDQELRLITPTDPEGSTDEDVPTGSGSEHCYQLTHDYLVPALREWLTRKQRETRRGRAELRLAERTALWEAKPENRHLPSVIEWVRIRALTRQKDWTEPQRRMMRRAGRLHVLRALGLAILIALGTWGGIEANGQLHSAELVASLETAGTAEVPRIIERLGRYRRWADPRLVRMLDETKPSGRAHLHARLALLPSDPTQADPIYDRLVAASPADLHVLLDLLDRHKAQMVPRLWSELEKANPGDPRLLASAGALARYDPEDPRWTALGGKVAEALVSLNPILLGSWLDALRPVRGKLKAPLETIFRDPSRPEGQHDLATSILADYAADDPGRLAELIIVSDPKSYMSLFPVVERQAAGVIPLFQAELFKIQMIHEKDTEPAKDERAERQARAAVALVRLGHAGEVWPLLRYSTDPRLRSFIVNWLQPLGADPRTMAGELARRDSPATRHPPPATQKMDAVLFHPETSTRRALILALGTYGTDGLPPGERESIIARLLDLYENDPDAGVHGAAEWTLRRWGYDLRLMSWGDGSIVPTSGQDLVIAGLDYTGLLHIRTFDAAAVQIDTFETRDTHGALHLVSADVSGRVLSDASESSLPAAQAQAIAHLKQHLPGLLPLHFLSDAERDQVFRDVTSITGQTRWGQSAKLTEINGRLRGKDRGDDRWYINGQGQTFAIVEGPLQFRMGTPPDDPDQINNLAPHPEKIDHRFAIAAKEVSIADYQKFMNFAQSKREFGTAPKDLDRYSPRPDGPMIGVNWYGAAAYCNWLSEREGIPEDQWCYLPNCKDQYAEGMTIKADALKLKGYRLPTEAEWEYACRAGSLTSRSYGFSIGLLGKYARYQANGDDHAWPCGSLQPNDLGVFDMLGNVYEWCQERYAVESTERAVSGKDERIENKYTRLLRGGAFLHHPAFVRSADRNLNSPSLHSSFTGFRLARTHR